MQAELHLRPVSQETSLSKVWAAPRLMSGGVRAGCIGGTLISDGLFLNINESDTIKDDKGKNDSLHFFPEAKGPFGPWFWHLSFF